MIIAIIFTSIERARIESTKVRCEEITYMALDSCFSKYAREIFEDYGIMMLWKDRTSFINEYKEFADRNCKYGKDMALKPMDILSIKESNSIINELKLAISDDGELIERQICDYMKLSVPLELVEEILNNSRTLSQSEGISEFNKKMESCEEALCEVEESVESISEMADVVKNCEKDPLQMLEEIQNRLASLKDLEKVIISDSDSTKSWKIEDANRMYEELKKAYFDFESWITITYENIRSMVTDGNTYLINISKAEDEINSIDDFLVFNKKDYQQKVYDLMKSEIDDVRNEILNADNDVYGVIENKEVSINQAEILLKIKNDITESKKLIDNYGDTPFMNIKGRTNLLKVIENDVAEALYGITGYDKSMFKIDYEKKSESKQKNEIVDFVEKIKGNGVINYVVNGELSDKEISMSELPSEVSDLNNGKEWANYNEAETAMRKALVGQYIFDKFICYTSGVQGSCLDYEVEYILKGKPCDKENIKEIVDDILLIREGFNFLYLLGDSAKKKEAYGMAAAITGFTGMPVVIRITQVLILAAWAYAESIVDVKELMEGKRVSIIKTSEEWNLSLTGIMNLAPKKEKTENSKGLLYEDYLRVFLFTQNKSSQIYRILDVIQLNISNKYNNNFRVKDCIVSVDFTAEYHMNRIFTDIGFIKAMINKKNKGFIIRVNQRYGYL